MSEMEQYIRDVRTLRDKVNRKDPLSDSDFGILRTIKTSPQYKSLVPDALRIERQNEDNRIAKYWKDKQLSL
jgi:hypothetical protein